MAVKSRRERHLYPSQRTIGETLYDPDAAAPLISACVNGDLELLHGMLSDKEWTAIASATIHRIYSDFDDLPPEEEENERLIVSKPQLNLAFMVEQAALHGHDSVVKRLLEAGSNQAIPYDKLITKSSVRAAIQNGNPKEFERLLAVMPEAANLYLGLGNCPLSEAISKNNVGLVELLLQYGADANARDRPWSREYHTSLIASAAFANKLEVVQSLLKHGAQVAQSGAVQVAAERGLVNILEVLVRRGASVNERLNVDSMSEFSSGPKHLWSSWVPLHFAAENSQASVIEWLLSRGADPEQEDINGQTPRDIASEKGMTWPVNISRNSRISVV